MFDDFSDTIPERAPIPTIVAYLRTRKPDCVQRFLTRRLTRGIAVADTIEVLYWAAVHAEVIRTELSSADYAEVVESLDRLAPRHQ